MKSSWISNYRMTSCPMKSHGLIHSSLENHVFTHNVLGEGQPQEESDSLVFLAKVNNFEYRAWTAWCLPSLISFTRWMNCDTDLSSLCYRVREFHARGARYCVKMIAVWKDLVVKRQCVIADRCRLQNRSRLRRLCGTQAATERE